MARNRPTLSDVGALAGVSRSTVSRVVNNSPSVNGDVRERVRRAVDMLGYQPDAAARALVSGQSDAIDLVVFDRDSDALSTNPFYARVMAGMLDALSGTYAQMRTHVFDGWRAPERLTDIVGAAGLGAVLVNVPGELAALCRRAPSRVVSLGQSGPGVAYVDTANTSGGQAAVHHLYEQGRRRIAAINGPPWSPCANGRWVGYMDAMRAASLPARWVDGGFSRREGAEGTRELLARHPDVDAIFVSCDMAATGTLQVLARSGRRVPDDVAVVGFDGGVLGMCTSPELTSVYQPVEQTAATAVRMLLGDEADRAAGRVMPTRLTVRESSVAAGR